MPRKDRYSAAAKELSERLAQAGYRKSPSTLESWAQNGMAPHPVRISRGRKGSTSEYPPGAFEQYLAVCKVMRPGRDVREAALRLIADGELPTSEELFRRALKYLLEDTQIDGDPLDTAERIYAEAQQDSDFAPAARLFQMNARNVPLTDARNGLPLIPEAVVEGAMVNMSAAMHGREFPDDQAISEVGAVFGLLESNLSPEEWTSRIRFIDAFYGDVANFESLKNIAAQVSPERLRAAVREISSDVEDIPTNLFDLLPKRLRGVMPVILGMSLVSMDDLGGIDWFNRVTAVSSIAEEWETA